MNDFLNLPARELVARLSRNELRAQALVEALSERIAAADPEIRAWQHFDAGQALTQARALDSSSANRGALHGLPIGVKDLMDTHDMPTTYGSPIYAKHQPTVDAACVASARTAGAIVMGKTVTTEFATFQPGPTRNPRSSQQAPHTPGGSSSGSAAAVAAGMVPVAFGTQTAGSIIRPAAYCGIVGYKPTHGTLSLAGVKPLSPSLDTIGALARTVDDAAFFVGTLANMPLIAEPARKLRVGICKTPYWSRAGEDTQRAIEHAASLLERDGAALHDINLPHHFDGLNAAQIDIMGYEAAAAFSPERREHSALFSPAFAALVQAGAQMDNAHFSQARKQAREARLVMQSLFADVDVILAPSTEGVAPAGLAATGDPVFNRMWSLLGNPCIHVPTGTGEAGLPLGVTLVGPVFEDPQLIAVAKVLERLVN